MVQRFGPEVSKASCCDPHCISIRHLKVILKIQPMCASVRGVLMHLQVEL